VADEWQEWAGAVTADFAMADEAIARARPEQSLVELAVREHARMVYRIAYSVLRNPMDAEDAVQEAFLRVLRYERKMAGVNDPKAWLARIAWRVAIERRKKVARLADQAEVVENDLISPAEGADRALLKKERDEFLERLIAALPDQLRDPFVLSTLEELSPREVGMMLGISEAAVRSRAFRARQILRERMETWMGVGK